MTKKSEYQRRYYKRHPEKRYANRKRYYDKTAYSPCYYRKWTQAEIDAVLDHNMTDSELSAQIGRSVASIQRIRNRYKEEMTE